MKILLVNNSTKHLPYLRKGLVGHDVEDLFYKPGVDFNSQDKDLVILSGGGGEGREANDVTCNGVLWYKDQMDFVASCDKPILGICMGFEIMAKAYGEDVPTLDKLVFETSNLTCTEKGWQMFGKHHLKQVEAHSWAVSQAPAGFDELARSENGVEAFYSEELKRFGTQFHPELGGTLKLADLIAI